MTSVVRKVAYQNKNIMIKITTKQKFGEFFKFKK